MANACHRQGGMQSCGCCYALRVRRRQVVLTLLIVCTMHFPARMSVLLSTEGTSGRAYT